MDELGVTEELMAQSRNRASSGGGNGGNFHIIEPDGTKKTIPGGVVGDGSIKLQRSQLVKVLRERLQKCKGDRNTVIIEGKVEDISFSPSSADVHIGPKDGSKSNSPKILTCRRIVGCDGINSKVREILANKVDRSFRTKSVRCPSANLIFRSIMAENPPQVSFGDFVSFRGKAGNSASMLSFHDTVAGGDQYRNLRPLSMARRPNYFLYQCKTVDEVYDSLEQEFPQLGAKNCISREAVQAFLDSKGVTFPKPTWTRRAACVVNGVPAVLVGDSLHHFPPDVGQGLNAGLLDAAHFLLMEDDMKQSKMTDAELANALTAYSNERVKEAESICRLIPNANPWYQYNLRGPIDRLGRSVFTARKKVESKLFRASEKLSTALGLTNVMFCPPVLSLLTKSNPPLAYSNVLRQHRQNVMVTSGLALSFAFLAFKLLLGIDVARFFVRRPVMKR
jgi:2-polyprenyl-6-methoxyphenol hydroxylase-like FAD-dependent oxidoreductase